MFIKLYLLFILFSVLFLKLDYVRAACDWYRDPLSGKMTWYKCENGVIPSCSDLPGGTCGAGVGCGPTGCYDCATSGTCGNTSCPAGWSWNSCATGQNTCQDQTVFDTCPSPGNPCATRSPIVEKVCNEKCGEYLECDSRTPVRCGGAWVSQPYNCHTETVRTGCQQSCGYEAFNCDRRGRNCIWDWNCHDINCRYEQQNKCDYYNYYREQCWGGDCIRPHMVDRLCNTCQGATTGGNCESTCRAAMVTKQCATGQNTCRGGCFPPPCDANNWGSCSTTCGGGVQTNECGGTKSCNTQSCCSAFPASASFNSAIASQSNPLAYTLNWSVEYGTNCPTNNNTLKLYVNECDAVEPATQLYATLPTNSTSTVYTGVDGKSYCGTIEANNGGDIRTSTRRWTVTYQPWWQVSGGGVMSGGDITSKVKTGQTLIKGESAVVAANGTIDLNNQNASTTNWQAQNAIGVISNKLNYRYDYDSVYSRVYAHIKPIESPFNNLYSIPTGLDITKVNYFHYPRDLNINADLNFGDYRVAFLAERDININKNVNFNKNVGLVALYAKGNINIDKDVGYDTAPNGVDPETLTANLEGIFLASGSFNTGTGTKQLRIEGPIIGISGVNFQRNLYSIWPNEFIVFRPDILMNLPKPLLRQNNLWMEGNP